MKGTCDWESNACEAMGHSMQPFVAGMARRGAEPKEFSGVLLAYAGKHYIATAAHCLKGITQRERVLAFTAASPTARALGKPEDVFLSRGSDVAIIRVRDEIIGLLSSTWFDVSNPTEAAVPGELVGVSGFPIARSVVHEGSRVEMRPISYLSEVTRRGAPDLAFESRPLDTGIDFLIEYPDGEKIHSNDLAFEMHPRGLSGAGVFAFERVFPGDLWAPRPRLVGIQSSFLNRSGLLRAVHLGELRMLIEAVRLASS